MSERWFGRRVLGRLPGLLAGFVAMAVGTAAMANAGLGLGPWQVFHQGISVHTGLALGTVQVLVGIPILALWWPLGERPGIGTVLNVALVGVIINVAMPALASPDDPAIAAQPAAISARPSSRGRTVPRSCRLIPPRRRPSTRAGQLHLWQLAEIGRGDPVVTRRAWPPRLRQCSEERGG